MNGAPVVIGGREFVVPRLRVAAYERAVMAIQGAEKVGQEGDPFGLVRLGAVCSAVVDLLAENYPDLTTEDVKGLLHMDELDAVLSGLLQAGGKQAVKPGEAVGP